MNKEILTEDDFYTYFKPFAIWLVKKKHKKFESLSSKKSRKYFKKFTKKWNSNKLKPIFYNIDKLLEKYHHLIQTNHEWKFKLSHKDTHNLTNCLNEVHEFNKFSDDDQKEKKYSKNEKNEENLDNHKKKRIMGPTLPENMEVLSKNQEKHDFPLTSKKSEIVENIENVKILKNEEKIEQIKQEKRFLKRKEKRDREEESPKKIGKDAIKEKKQQLNKILNGEKDDDFVENAYENEEKNSFLQAKMREKMRMEKKEAKFKEKREKINEKVMKFQEDENRKVKDLLESLGLKDKYKTNFK